MQNKKFYSLVVTLSVAVCLFLSSFMIVDDAFAQQKRRRKKTGQTMSSKPADPRSATRIQTLAVNVGAKKKAVELLYLNMPWGQQTFSFIEDGGNDYYSNRTWPFAHIKVNTAANYQGKSITPGDYILYITPKNEKNPQMSISLASVKLPADKKTFLVNGDVFTETPEDIQVVTSRAIRFDKGAPMLKSLKIDLTASGSDVNIGLHYGDRTFTDKLTVN